jgi:hypothetical protein
LNGFAEEKPCIAKQSKREYPLRGLAQTCRPDAPAQGDLDDAITASNDRRHDNIAQAFGWVHRAAHIVKNIEALPAPAVVRQGQRMKVFRPIYRTRRSV